MANVYTVSQVNSYIRHLFEEDFALTHISVKGEVSNCKYHSSGHIYFTLKEKNSAIPADSLCKKDSFLLNLFVRQNR